MSNPKPSLSVKEPVLSYERRGENWEVKRVVHNLYVNIVFTDESARDVERIICYLGRGAEPLKVCVKCIGKLINKLLQRGFSIEGIINELINENSQGLKGEGDFWHREMDGQTTLSIPDAIAKILKQEVLDKGKNSG